MWWTREHQSALLLLGNLSAGSKCARTGITKRAQVEFRVRY